MKTDSWSEPGVILVMDKSNRVLFRVVDDFDAMINLNDILMADFKSDVLKQTIDLLEDVSAAGIDVDTDSVDSLQDMAWELENLSRRADKLHDALVGMIEGETDTSSADAAEDEETEAE